MNTWKDDILVHEGRKGMKHGRRRYRNYDGTLTPAGRERYGVGPPRVKEAVSNVAKKLSRREQKAQKEIAKKASAKAAERKAKKAQEELQKEREEFEAQKAKMAEFRNTSEENAQKRLEVDRAKMNNEELQAAINRLKLEREYDALVNPPKPVKQQINKKSAMERIMEIMEQMDNIKRINTTMNDVVGLAKEIKKLVKGDDNEAYNKLKREADLDKLKFDMETRNEKRAQWKREENDRLDKKIADADKKAKDINDAAIAARHEEEEKEKKRRATEPDFWVVHHTGLKETPQ